MPPVNRVAPVRTSFSGRHLWPWTLPPACAWFGKCIAFDLTNGRRLKRSIDQLRGIEGARILRIYGLLAKQHGVTWKRRSYDPESLGCFRSAEPLPVRCDGLPAWASRSGGPCRWLCSGDRVPAHWQATLLRLRHRRTYGRRRRSYRRLSASPLRPRKVNSTCP